MIQSEETGLGRGCDYVKIEGEMLILTLFPCRMVGMGRKGVSQGPTPFFEDPRVTSPRQAAVFPLGPPSLRAATA